MGKKDEHSGTFVVSEGLIERLIETLEKTMAASTERDINRDNWKRNLFTEERDVLRKEFKRISGILEKYDPKTREYHDIADSLYRITSMFTYVDG